MATKAKKAKTKAAKVKPKRATPVRAKAMKLARGKASPAKVKAAKAPKIATKPARAAKPSKSKATTSRKSKTAKSRPAKPMIAWPVKTREMHNHHMNSTVWNSFKFRDDDVVVATYAKSGTTWTQQIVAQLIFNGAEGVDVAHLSPWVDLRIIPPEVIAGLEGQTHRRFIKTHLPVDALVFSPKAKYIFVGRDGRDAAWSLFNHHSSAVDEYFNVFNNTPGLVGPPLERGTSDVHEFYTNWFAGDGFPYWPVWENIRSWWGIRNLPNVKLIHFNDLKKDLAGTIREVAAFLEIPIDEATFPKIVEHCTFDYMKAHAELAAPRGGIMWNGGARTFINKGTNGRWRDTLSAGEVAAYEAHAVAQLGPECAKWLAQGKSA